MIDRQRGQTRKMGFEAGFGKSPRVTGSSGPHGGQVNKGDIKTERESRSAGTAWSVYEEEISEV